MAWFIGWRTQTFLTLYAFRYSRVSNRRGGRNKREGKQIAAKIIDGEGAINGEAGKNLQKLINEEVGIYGEAGKNRAIRNFIEIKSSNDLQQK